MAPTRSRKESSGEQILKLIRSEDVARLALELARVHSPRGFEREVGDFIHSWMVRNGFESFKQEVAPGRSNVIGILRGSEGHPRLIFNSHMDTGFGLPEDYWITGPENKFYVDGREEGELLVGRSVINDKGPMAAFMMATRAIKESGVKLRGDVVMTAVIGEIGQAPVDEWQGTRYEGKGFGTRHLVTHGIVGDYALVAEGTNYAVSRAEAGDCWFKVNVYGKGAVYTPMIERPFRFEDNPSAIVKAAKVIQAIEDWAPRYEKEHSVDFEDGTIVPKVNIGALRAGVPVRISQTAGICTLYVDVRLAPGQTAEEARAELETVVRKCGVDFTVEQYLYRRGYIAKHAEKLVEAVKRAHKDVFGTETKKVAAPYCSMWRDLNVFNENGIPAITYGPPSVSYKTLTGMSTPSIRKQDLFDAAKVYALTALSLCS